MRDTFKPLFPNRVYFITPDIVRYQQRMKVVGRWRDGNGDWEVPQVRGDPLTRLCRLPRAGIKRYGSSRVNNDCHDQNEDQGNGDSQGFVGELALHQSSAQDITAESPV